MNTNEQQEKKSLQAAIPFHLMAKPAGPRCNMACEYCFYNEKNAMFQDGEAWRMPDAVLDAYIRQVAEAMPGPEVQYAFQGGEPTLAGLDFFRRVVELAGKYAAGRRISYALQTNGLLLDDEWCEFLAENNFLVGISIDGPKWIHDRHRKDRKGGTHFEDVLGAVERMKKYNVQFNILTVVNRLNARHGLEVYRFLKGLNVQHMQFIPLVERRSDPKSVIPGLELGAPPDLEGKGEPLPVMPWSVRPEEFGEFLCQIFDEWVRNDVGSVFVQTFEVALGAWMGLGSGMCVYAERCGRALILEHNGDVYACDHYVYPSYLRGNILGKHLRDIVDSPEQIRFGNDKTDRLPQCCRECRWLSACRGACPKHRFMRAKGGEWGLNYLCAGHKRFFAHVDPHLKTLAKLLRDGHSPQEIMRGMAARK
ncbi:MAG: anaerobic sulfatase maturase [bacterium]